MSLVAVMYNLYNHDVKVVDETLWLFAQAARQAFRQGMVPTAGVAT